MAIATDNNHGIGPFFPKMKDQLFQQRGNITLLTPSSKDCGDQLADKPHRCAAKAAMIMVILIEQVQFARRYCCWRHHNPG